MRNCAIKQALLSSAGLFALVFANSAIANPLSATVTTGSASIASSATKTQIDQKSEDVVIDWSSFNIGAGQTTQFLQPNAQAIAVNRIGGSAPSQILGTLDANGRIVLINGNGMLFGKGSQVNVGSLVATSTGGSDADVLSGKFTQAGNSNASIVNQGRVATSQAGLVALVAPNVTNTGTVNAKFGTVALAAANKFTVDFTGDGLVSFAAQGDVNGRAVATNTGFLSGANVSLTARAAEGLATGVVNVSGTLVAQTARNAGGTIILDAGDGGTVEVAGELDASGTAGGKILVGGDVHGGAVALQDFGSGTIQDAATTEITANARIKADGKTGAGGDIVIWSDSRTSFAGSVSATGKTSGGFAEVSSHGILAFTGAADLLSANGKTGTLLLDPENVTISTAASVTDSCSAGVCTPTANDSILNVTTLEDLLATSNVKVTTGSSGSQPGDITVASVLTWSANTLTLDAYNSIYIDAPISAAGTAGLTLKTNDGGTGGDYYFNGGNITFANTGEALTINGQAFALVTNISGLASAIAADPSSNYALANNYDASADGVYRSSPVPTEFGGVFEGLGNTISNLSIKDSAGHADVGLLSQLASTGTLRDIALTSETVYSAQRFQIIGGLVAINNGLLLDDSVNASFSSVGQYGGVNAFEGILTGDNVGAITGSSTSGTMNAIIATLGGLAGEATGPIDHSSSSVSISTNQAIAGGLVGIDNGSISYSSTTGTVLDVAAENDTYYLGGLVGLAGTSSAISYSHASGEDGGTIYLASDYVGGLVGELEGTIDDSYATGNIIGTGILGGLVGSLFHQTPSTAITNSYATGSITGPLYIGEAGVVLSDGTAGGFVGGDSDGNISNCHATGSITGTYEGGGFIGGLGEGTISNSWASGNFDQTTYNYQVGISVGGFAGVNGGTITNSYATGNITGYAVNAGGLVGEDDGQISNSYATGSVESTEDYEWSAYGGLVGSIGSTGGTITNSYATGSVNAPFGGYVGGLVGENVGAISQSFATGAVNGTVVPAGYASVGGLVGLNAGSISDSYAMGSTTIGPNGTAGALVGRNDPDVVTSDVSTITRSYATGPIFAGTGSYVGGLVGFDQTDAGAITSSYWNTQTTGVSESSQGTGNLPNEPGVTGMTTTQLQSALPSGFSGSVWATVNTATFPYFAWQIPSGTPQVISGTVTDAGTAVSGLSVFAVGSGSAINPLVAMGSSANGYYYLLLAPGTIEGSSQVLTYASGGTGGATLTENASGSLANVDIYSTYLFEPTSDGAASTLAANFATAIGSDAVAQSYVNGLAVREIDVLGGSFVINQGIDATTLMLSSTGTVTQTAAVTVANLDLQGAGGNFALINSNNNVGTLAAHTGTVTLNDGANALGIGTVNGTNGVNVTTFSLSDTGSVTQTQVIAATNLDLLGAGGNFTLASGSNDVGTLAANTGTIDFANGNALIVGTVAGTTGVSASGLVTLTTTITGDGLTINGPLAGTAVDLASAGTITQNSAGTITATTLTGSSNGAVTLTSANDIAGLGAFATSNGALSLTTGESLAVNGPVNTGTGNLSLTTTGTGSNIVVDGALTDSGTATLTSAGTISEGSGGVITAATLTGSANGAVVLTGNNAVTSLGAITTNGGSLSFTDAQSLTINTAFNMGTANLTFATSGTGSNLAIDAALTGATIDLVSSGAISQNSAGVITATTLTGSSSGATTLTSANQITDLGAFTNSAAGGFALTDGKTLTVNGAVNAGSGNLSLTTTGAGNNIVIEKSITDGATARLVSSGNISEGATVVVTAATLSGSAGGSTTLNGANQIASLGPFTNTGGNFALTDDQNLAIVATVNTGAHIANLNDQGTLGESGTGLIDANVLEGSSTGGATLNGANKVVFLDAFTNSGAGGLSFTDSRTFTVNGAVNAGTGDITLATTGTNSNIDIEKTIATGGTAALNSAGTIQENGGTITATTLAGNAAGATTLNGANEIAQLGPFTNTGGIFGLTDDQALTLVGLLDSGTHATVLKGESTLAESGAGALETSALDGSTVGGVTLNGANQIGDLDTFTNDGAGGFALTNDQTLVIDGAVSVGSGNLALTTTGTGNIVIEKAVRNGGSTALTSAGTIAEGSVGSLTTGTLTGSAAGTTMLNGANQVTTLGAFTDTGGNFALTDGRSLTVLGTMNTGTKNLTLQTTSGDLVISGPIDGNTVTLGSAAGEVDGTGAITARLLNVTADTGIDLTGPNDITTIGTNSTNSGPDIINQ
jgi:filamentous hemagglutinin family protein